MAFAGFSPGEAEGLRRAMSRRAVGGGDALVRGEVRGGGGGERGASEECGAARVRPDRRLLGLRLPEGALGGVRAARLPVHVAAGALRARVPVRAAERAADGLLPAGHARARGAAARIYGAAAGRLRLDRRVQRWRTAGVRMGLGYVSGVSGEDVRAIVDGARAGRAVRVGRAARLPLRDAGRRSRAAGLGRGARRAGRGGRREALWRLGVAAPGVRVAGGTQLALPVDVDAPELERADAVGADAGRLRIDARDAARASARADAAGARGGGAHERRPRADPHGATVRVAGMVVARQRPATAKGITFMLLEDELGTINLIVPIPVYERCRLAVRAEPLLMADGKLERREGMINVLVLVGPPPGPARHAARRGPPHRAAPDLVERRVGGRPACGCANGPQLRAEGVSCPQWRPMQADK